LDGFWERVGAALARELSDLNGIQTVHIGFRLLGALVFGGLLGWQREHVGKAAGLRTHMLVCLGSALFVAVPELSGIGHDGVSRVIQGLTAGIGFIGAGAIIKTETPVRIQGLTTAATLWFTAAIGVTVGMGRGATAALATAVAFIILWVLPYFEHHQHDDPNHPPEDAPKTPSEQSPNKPTQVPPPKHSHQKHPRKK